MWILCPQNMFSEPLTMLAHSCLFPLQPGPFRSGEGRSRAWPGNSPRGTSSSIPIPIMSCIRDVGSGGVRTGRRGSHVNPASSRAFLRTSSKEDPAETEMGCLYGGKTLGTFSMTLMSSWVCEVVSRAGCNRTVPGREEEVAGVRAGGQVLVPSSLEDTVACLSQHHHQLPCL